MDYRWHATRRSATYPRPSPTCAGDPNRSAPAVSLQRLASTARTLRRHLQCRDAAILRRHLQCRNSAPTQAARIEPCRRDPTFINDTIRREHSPPLAIAP